MKNSMKTVTLENTSQEGVPLVGERIHVGFFEHNVNQASAGRITGQEMQALFVDGE